MKEVTGREAVWKEVDLVKMAKAQEEEDWED